MASPEFDMVPFSFREMNDEQAWEAERGRGSARPARAAPGRARPRPPVPRPRPRPRSAVSAATRFDEPAAPCVCPAHGTEYVRWVQSALNRAEGLSLPVDGVMSAGTRSALRNFQRRKGLPADGIAGPDTEQALRDAGRPGDAGATPPEPAQDAGEVYEFEMLELESPASMPTLRQGSRGSAVSDLQRRLAAAGFSPGAVDGFFGALTHAAVRAFQGARGLAVDGVVGPQTWGALLGGAPGAGAPPARPTPAPAPAPGNLPAAWSGGPVDAPPWLPPKRSHSSITCGSNSIPAHLPPESVTRGWTPRTQAIANIIRGPLFGWRNVEGGADGGQSGHVSGSYHYCGRAIDSFPPGVLWDTRATGAGLSAGWRMANWAAHNAAALNVSQVIFYDRIWTADRGGWRPYTNPTGSTNSLQHRDHVHISVY